MDAGKDFRIGQGLHGFGNDEAEGEQAVPVEFVRELRLAAAIHWYERGEVSQEKAAYIAGLDRTDFLLALSREKVDAFVVDLDDLKRELSRG